MILETLYFIISEKVFFFLIAKPAGNYRFIKTTETLEQSVKCIQI